MGGSLSASCSPSTPELNSGFLARYRQTGTDLGPDIWGEREAGEGTGETVCVQGVNRGRRPNRPD